MAHIAWIEDDYDRISSLVKLLEKEHFIWSFRSWEEVEKHLEKILSCDVIILDIILPPIEINPYMGLFILEQLRLEYKYQKPVIACTRVQNPGVLRRLRELNVTEILHKPIRPSVLHKVVTEALKEV